MLRGRQRGSGGSSRSRLSVLAASYWRLRIMGGFVTWTQCHSRSYLGLFEISVFFLRWNDQISIKKLIKYYFHEQILLSKPTKELICHHFCDVVYFSGAQIEKTVKFLSFWSNIFLCDIGLWNERNRVNLKMKNDKILVEIRKKRCFSNDQI